MLNFIVIAISSIILGVLALWGSTVSTVEYRASHKERVLYGLAWLGFAGLHVAYWSNV